MERKAPIDIGIVSDTHGYLDARVLQAVAHCQVVIHAGDIGNAEVLQQLQGPTRTVIAIRGNNDEPRKWPPQDRKILHDLLLEQTLSLPGGNLVVVHGHKQISAARRHQQLRRLYPQARAIVYGHSHRMVLDQEHMPWVINPGAAGKARTYGGPSCLLLHADHTGWRIKSLRFEKA
jgi:putative phosphoesterase